MSSTASSSGMPTTSVATLPATTVTTVSLRPEDVQAIVTCLAANPTALAAVALMIQSDQPTLPMPVASASSSQNQSGKLRDQPAVPTFNHSPLFTQEESEIIEGNLESKVLIGGLERGKAFELALKWAWLQLISLGHVGTHSTHRRERQSKREALTPVNTYI